MPTFARPIGIDDSGVQTPTASLKGLQKTAYSTEKSGRVRQLRKERDAFLRADQKRRQQ